MRSTTRTLIVAIYLILAAASIAYAQTLMQIGQDWGALILTAIAVLSAFATAVHAWYSYGTRIGDLEDWQQDICDWREDLDATMNEKLDRIIANQEANNERG